MELARQSYRHLLSDLAGIGVTDQAAIDLWAAVHLGLTGQQVANDPGGHRWVSLVDEAVDMFLAHVGAQAERREHDEHDDRFRTLDGEPDPQPRR